MLCSSFLLASLFHESFLAFSFVSWHVFILLLKDYVDYVFFCS